MSVAEPKTKRRVVQSVGPPTPPAELKVFSGGVVVRDRVRNKVYEIRLVQVKTPDTVADLRSAEHAIRTRWQQVRCSGWASPDNFRDPELAAALRAVQKYAVEYLRLRPCDFNLSAACLVG